MKVISSFLFGSVYPFVIFLWNFISRPRSFLFFHPAARTSKVPSLQFNHAAFLLYGCAIQKASWRFASPISLLYVRRWVYEFYNGMIKLLLCLWHVYFMGC